MEGLIVQGEEGVRSSLGDQRVQRPRGRREQGIFREQETVRCGTRFFLSGSLTCGSE